MMAPETVVNVDNRPTSQQASPQQDKPLDWIKINIDYFKTTPGLLKIVQLILGILCFSLITAYYAGFAMFVAVTCFITTLMWSFVYLLSVQEALKTQVNWVLSELISVAVETGLYLIAFIVIFCSSMSSYDHRYGANIAGGIFGLLNTVAYGASAYLLFKDHKASTGAAS